MRASKFADAQKAFITKQGEAGIPVAEICRKAGISQATFFNRKKRYGGLGSGLNWPTIRWLRRGRLRTDTNMLLCECYNKD
jgi:putative transposase